jgi:hypothetical protein
MFFPEGLNKGQICGVSINESLVSADGYPEESGFIVLAQHDGLLCR